MEYSGRVVDDISPGDEGEEEEDDAEVELFPGQQRLHFPTELQIHENVSHGEKFCGGKMFEQLNPDKTIFPSNDKNQNENGNADAKKLLT